MNKIDQQLLQGHVTLLLSGRQLTVQLMLCYLLALASRMLCFGEVCQVLTSVDAVVLRN